jgi:hypothetical protein
VEKILLIRRMKPLAFTVGVTSAAMRDIETLQHSTAAQAQKSGANQRLTDILNDAAERREKLVRGS